MQSDFETLVEITDAARTADEICAWAKTLVLNSARDTVWYFFQAKM